jgi:fumarate hydratase class I
MRELRLPVSDEEIRSLNVGDPVALTGVLVTGRDMVHKWMAETFIKHQRHPKGDDLEVYEAIKPLLDGSAIYHCGPVVTGMETKDYRFIAAGPTTSAREEPYQGDVMRHFNLKGVIGKGGMGAKTAVACQEVPGVYFHAIGGAASVIAERVVRVLDVFKLDFGMPEAMWVIEVKEFPVVVTIDAHGGSLHSQVRRESKLVLDELLGKAWCVED